MLGNDNYQTNTNGNPRLLQTTPASTCSK